MSRHVFVVGVASTVVGAMLIHSHIERVEREIVGGDLVTIAVLTADVTPGTELSANMVAGLDLPERYLESRHVRMRDVDRAVGMRVGLSGKAGEALLWTDLAGMQGEVRTLSQLVPSGMRAVPVRLRRNSLSQLIRPGDAVDVLFTTSSGIGQGEGKTTTLLQSVLVLAVGSYLGGDGGGSLRSSTGEVTLSVTPEQGRLLAARSTAGDLQLALRNPDDLVVDSEAYRAVRGPAQGGQHVE